MTCQKAFKRPILGRSFYNVARSIFHVFQNGIILLEKISPEVLTDVYKYAIMPLSTMILA